MQSFDLIQINLSGAETLPPISLSKLAQRLYQFVYPRNSLYLSQINLSEVEILPPISLSKMAQRL